MDALRFTCSLVYASRLIKTMPVYSLRVLLSVDFLFDTQYTIHAIVCTFKILFAIITVCSLCVCEYSIHISYKIKLCDGIYLREFINHQKI